MEVLARKSKIFPIRASSFRSQIPDIIAHILDNWVRAKQQSIAAAAAAAAAALVVVVVVVVVVVLVVVVVVVVGAPAP